MEKGANKCCKDELKLIKLQDSYKLDSAGFRLSIDELVIIKNHHLANSSLINQVSSQDYNNHSPPRYPAVPLCIMNCIFRI